MRGSLHPLTRLAFSIAMHTRLTIVRVPLNRTALPNFSRLLPRSVDWYYASQVVPIYSGAGFVPALMTLGCASATIPCPTASIYYTQPLLAQTTGATFNYVVGGVSVQQGGTFVVASPTLMYVGADTTSANGGLYKYVGTLSTATAIGASWQSTSFAQGLLLNAPGSIGVHGLTGRFEGNAATYVLYLTTASIGATVGNSLFRYDTSFDGSSVAGAGFNFLVAAPSTSYYLGVYAAPFAANPPSFGAVALNTTVAEHAPAGTVIGSLAYTDVLSRAATAFQWLIVNDPSGGMFAITAAGVLTVSNSTLNPPRGGGFNFATGPRSYTLSVVAADVSNPSNIRRAYTTVIVQITEIDDAPVLSPSSQLVALQELLTSGVPRVGSTAAAPLTAYKENGPTSPYYSATTFSLLPATLNSLCGTPLANARVATTTGVAAGPPMFAVNASGYVTLIANAVTATGTPWTDLAPIVFNTAFVRIAYALCINTSDAFGAWSAGYAYVVSLPDPSLGFTPAIITSVTGASALPANAGGCGAAAPGPTAVITFRGSGFGPAGTSPLTTTITYGPTGVEYACTPLANNTNTSLSCTASAGQGSNMSFVVTVNGQANTPPSTALSISYALPNITSVNTTSGSVAALKTLGGDQLIVSGTNFGCSASLAYLTLYNSATGVSYTSANPCVHSATTPNSLLTCVAPPGAGANLGLSIRAGSATSVTTAGKPASWSGVSYSAPVITAVSTPAGASPTYGGAGFTVAGSGFGPAGTIVDFALFSSNATALAAAAVTLGRNLTVAAALNAALLAALPVKDVPSNVTLPAAALPAGVFGAAPCLVVSDSAISCTMGPGTGAGMSLLLSVGGQATAQYAAQLAYSPPQITGFSGVGVQFAPTTGGSTVIISGSNLGA